MISGRTFAREMIALRQRETKRAGRILALQGQNPGQLELRTHSEFGANLSVTPGGFAFLCLRAIPRRSSPAGYHSLRLRPAKTKPQYLLLQPAMPNPRDERLIYTPHHPVRSATGSAPISVKPGPLFKSHLLWSQNRGIRYSNRKVDCHI